ncbi:rCG63398 [Rattus norvegicus]|uniref:RCG63398 n=1 Tax=Rattus norvegicus TaxID=10116 RepID=A6J5W3_RAT|nr:rCG63398 [Rattus norvegicus]
MGFCMQEMRTFIKETLFLFYFILLYCIVWLFGTGLLCVALAALELSVDQTGLELRDLPASDS